jgi:hypothetical protein
MVESGVPLPPVQDAKAFFPLLGITPPSLILFTDTPPLLLVSRVNGSDEVNGSRAENNGAIE